MTTTLISTDPENDRCPACGKALSRLSASPPAEIERFVAMIRNDSMDLRHKHVREEIADALQRMAQEVEMLLQHCQTANKDREHDADEIEKLETRIAELEAAAKIPLREEIADIIRHLGTSVTETEAGEALQRLAQEVERLRSLATTKGALGILEDQLGKIVKLRARIAELEAERDIESGRADGLAAALKKTEADRATIKAKTNEKCAQIADHESQAVDGGEYWIAARIAKHIRALNQPEAGEKEK